VYEIVLMRPFWETPFVPELASSTRRYLRALDQDLQALEVAVVRAHLSWNVPT
jgi:hypothetical protein